MTPTRRTFVIVTLVLVGGVVLLWTFRHLAWFGNIEIVSAEYGVPGRTCTAGPGIKQRVGEACGGLRPRCMVSVSAHWCDDRDPAPGLLKTLTVEYKCGATRKRAVAVDHTPLVLACP